MAGVLLYVHVHGGAEALCRTADLSDVVTVYIDEESMKLAMELSPRGVAARPAGDALTNRWAMDTFRVLIYTMSGCDVLTDFDHESSDWNQSFLYLMLDRVHGAFPAIGIEEALLILRDDPARFTAMYEHVMGLVEGEKVLLSLKAGR
jgi:hypothetical protein